jgi:hypothetical protein
MQDVLGNITRPQLKELLAIGPCGVVQHPANIGQPIAFEDRGDADRRVLTVGSDAPEVFRKSAIPGFGSIGLTQVLECGRDHFFCTSISVIRFTQTPYARPTPL